MATQITVTSCHLHPTTTEDRTFVPQIDDADNIRYTKMGKTRFEPWDLRAYGSESIYLIQGINKINVTVVNALQSSGYAIVRDTDSPTAIAYLAKAFEVLDAFHNHQGEEIITTLGLRHRETGRKFALATVDTSNISSEKQRLFFRRVTESLSGLTPNSPQIIGVHDDRQTFFTPKGFVLRNQTEKWLAEGSDFKNAFLVKETPSFFQKILSIFALPYFTLRTDMGVARIDDYRVVPWFTKSYLHGTLSHSPMERTLWRSIVHLFELCFGKR